MNNRRTKIICTLGPNAENYSTLLKLAEYMDVARFNFSHGTYEEHLMKLSLLKKVRKETGRPIPALLDTKGPEIRTGLNKDNEKIKLVSGENIIITTKECLSDEKIISVTYKGIVNDVKIGDKILIDDGLMELMVLEKHDTDINCKILSGGLLSEHKGVNLPGIKLDLPDLTEKDVKDIEFGIENGFDIIAASFVRSAKCIKEIRKILDKHNSKMLIIAKIENQDGINNVDEIIDVADGLMVARGDLGVEVKTSEVPYLQKMMIKKCNQKSKLVITATQMLDSMIKNPRPTRAEVTDVANAIYDGTDCIMLSGETANGKYPVEAVKMMNDIAIETEPHINNQGRIDTSYGTDIKNSITNNVCRAIVNTATDLNAKAIVAPTITGHTARMLSKFKPIVPIYAISKNEQVARQLMLYYGVEPSIFNLPENSDAIVDDALMHLKDTKKLNINDTVVVAFGEHTTNEIGIAIKPHTNTMRVETI